MAAPAITLTPETREKVIELLHALVLAADETPRKPIEPEPGARKVIAMRSAS